MVGKVVLLYFGYTQCPDECPTTLANAALVLSRIGGDAQKVRMLFVTVDPNRDTAPVLSAYVRNFAPEIEPRSRNTWENARESARLLRPHGLRRVVLVSDRAHLPRAALLFRLAGLEVAGRAGIRPSSPLWELGALLRELAALPKSLIRAARRGPQ